MSPNLFKSDGDGAIVPEAIREAQRAPVATPLNPRKLARKPRYYKVEFRKGKVAVPTVVSVPDQEEDEAPVVDTKPGRSNPQHATPKSNISCSSLVRNLGSMCG